MIDFFEDLHDDENSGDPSFSFYDFKKWLSKQKKPKHIEESVSDSVESEKKETLKRAFKKRFSDKMRRKRDF